MIQQLVGTVRDVAGHAVSRTLDLEVTSPSVPGQWGPKILAWIQPMPESVGLSIVGPLSVANSLNPGDTLWLAPGVYGMKGTTFSWTRAGLPTNPITIAARPGDFVKILGRVDMLAPWQRFRNIHFEGPTGNVGGPGPNGEANLLNIGNHSEVDHCEVYGAQWHAGISASDATDYRILNNYIHDNGGLNGDYTDSQNNTSHGAYISPSSYGLVANNLVEHNDAKGIMGRHDSNHILVVHNTFVANGRHGLAIAEQAHDWIAANNILLNNGNVKGGFGIACDSTTANILERRNVGWHNGMGGGGSHWESGPVISEPKVADPLCVKPAIYTPQQDPAPNWDHHLKAGSPAIGYGDPDYGMPFDIEGRPRNGRFDCGAYQG